MSKARRQQRKRQRTQRRRIFLEVAKRSGSAVCALHMSRHMSQNVNGRTRVSALRNLMLLLAVLVVGGCNLYNEDMWDSCPTPGELTWHPEGDPQCGYSVETFQSQDAVASSCTLTAFTATDEHGCNYVKQWRCANETTLTQYVDTIDMWSVVTVETPTCAGRFEGPLTNG